MRAARLSSSPPCSRSPLRERAGCIVTGVGVAGRRPGLQRRQGTSVRRRDEGKARAASRAARARSTLAAVGDEPAVAALDDELGSSTSRTTRCEPSAITSRSGSRATRTRSRGASSSRRAIAATTSVTLTDEQLRGRSASSTANPSGRSRGVQRAAGTRRDAVFATPTWDCRPTTGRERATTSSCSWTTFATPTSTTERPDRTYIGGFFTSFFNELADRNVMTIDAFDWVHRTGANPPDEPFPSDICASRPARPHLYEATFAHEYQHLLHYYTDPDETSGSTRVCPCTRRRCPATSTRDPDHAHRLRASSSSASSATWACAGPTGPGGPENSLTFWGDQGDGDELLRLRRRRVVHGHLATARGPTSSRRSTSTKRTVCRPCAPCCGGGATSPRNRREIVHDWAATVALDSLIDHEWQLAGGPTVRYRTDSLDATSTGTTTTHSRRRRAAQRLRLRAVARRRRQLPPRASSARSRSTAPRPSPDPIEWVVDTSPPLQPGDPAFYSGSGSTSIARSCTRSRSRGRTDAHVRDALRDGASVRLRLRPGLDRRRRDLSEPRQRHHDGRVDPGAIRARGQQPAGPERQLGRRRHAEMGRQLFDLSAYAGDTILLSFRYVTDSSVDGAGWWIDDVRIGDQPIADGELARRLPSASHATDRGERIHGAARRVTPTGRITRSSTG